MRFFQYNNKINSLILLKIQRNSGGRHQRTTSMQQNELANHIELDQLKVIKYYFFKLNFFFCRVSLLLITTHRIKVVLHPFVVLVTIDIPIPTFPPQIPPINQLDQSLNKINKKRRMAMKRHSKSAFGNPCCCWPVLRICLVSATLNCAMIQLLRCNLRQSNWERKKGENRGQRINHYQDTGGEKGNGILLMHKIEWRGKNTFAKLWHNWNQVKSNSNNNHGRAMLNDGPNRWTAIWAKLQLQQHRQVGQRLLGERKVRNRQGYPAECERQIQHARINSPKPFKNISRYLTVEFYFSFSLFLIFSANFFVICHTFVKLITIAQKINKLNHCTHYCIWNLLSPINS